MTVEQIKEKLKDLKTKDDEIELHGVCPNLIQEAIGKFDNRTYDINGWECDYWVKTDKYAISGSMFYGTARISLR